MYFLKPEANLLIKGERMILRKIDEMFHQHRDDYRIHAAVKKPFGSLNSLI